MTVDEYAANGYEPYAAELPDPSITVSDMQEYGYTWDGMLPLKEKPPCTFTKKRICRFSYSMRTAAKAYPTARRT